MLLKSFFFWNSDARESIWKVQTISKDQTPLWIFNKCRLLFDSSLPACLPLCLSVCLSTYLLIYLSIFLYMVP